MAKNAYKKGVIALEDINFDTNRNNESFNRNNSQGVPQSMSKINASHIPVSQALSFNNAESIEDFLSEIILAIGAGRFIGVYADLTALYAAWPAPQDDSIAWNTETKSMWDWDETLGTPAWTNTSPFLGEYADETALVAAHPTVYREDAMAWNTETQSLWYWDQDGSPAGWADSSEFAGFPSSRVSIVPTATTNIDWSTGGVFDLGTLPQATTLTFSNISQTQEITINYTSTASFNLTLPGTVTALNGGSSTLDSYNSVRIQSVNGSTAQEAEFYTDTAPVDKDTGIIPSAVVLVEDANHTLVADDIGKRIILNSATADRDLIIDPSLFADFSAQISAFNKVSGYKFRIVVSNTGTQSINDSARIDYMLWNGDGVVTINGDSATNINICAAG